MRKSRSHLVIPDTQVKPGVPINHMDWIGRYIVARRPDVVIHLGDAWDMPSLSDYDRGKKSFEGRRYRADIDAGNRALERLTTPIAKARGYKPRLVILRGNHEDRITRAVESSPELEGAIGDHDFNDAALGWAPVPFLTPIEIDGVSYCHYFCRSANGNVSNRKHGAPSARAQVQREMRSCTSGHKQGLDVHIQPTATGLLRGIIAGSCYQHDEDFLTPQMRHYWRGVLLKHEVEDGSYNLMEVSLEYLKRRFG